VAARAHSSAACQSSSWHTSTEFHVLCQACEQAVPFWLCLAVPKGQPVRAYAVMQAYASVALVSPDLPFKVPGPKGTRAAGVMSLREQSQVPNVRGTPKLSSLAIGSWPPSCRALHSMRSRVWSKCSRGLSACIHEEQPHVTRLGGCNRSFEDQGCGLDRRW
jgi:hypothetical protein